MGVIVDTSRRLQSAYVPVGEGVRLAVDIWLPVERTAVGGTVGTVMRVTRYHRAEAPPEPGPEADTNAAAGDLFNRAGFALVVVDARGTGASFGTRTGELAEREIKDYGELIGWVAAQPMVERPGRGVRHLLRRPGGRIDGRARPCSPGRGGGAVQPV